MADASRRLNLNGLEIAYDTAGDEQSPAVVFLHGWASSRRMWESSRVELEGYRTVAVDLPGHGESEKPEWSWYSIPNYAEVVLGLLRDLGLDRPALVGHSMGGTIALEAASRDPGAVGRVVVVNPVVTGRVYSRSLSFPDTWIRSAVGLSRRVWPTASRLLTRPPETLRRHAPAHVQRNTEDLGRTSADSVLGSMQAVLGYDLTERLPGIRSPLLVIVGDEDRIVSPAEGDLAARSVPGARLRTLSAGHHPNDEVPESFHRTLRSFLAEGEHG